MRTYIECIPCFFKQAIEACKMIGLSDDKTKAIIDKVALQVPEIELEASPPVMAQIIHRIIKEHTNNPDPYRALKQKSNEIALAVYPALKMIVRSSDDTLLKAVEIAIAGNIIDYGALSDLDINKEIHTILNSEEEKIKAEEKTYFAYGDFVSSLKHTKNLLYLADNAGEIVCDRVLIEEIKTAYPDIQIFCAVRGAPIINDCLVSDAVYAGIDTMATIISNGSDAPGTILESCSDEFLEVWDKSDMIISKGQGNFESLSGVERNIFFMFIVKCQVLARDIGCRLRDVIFYKNQ